MNVQQVNQMTLKPGTPILGRVGEMCTKLLADAPNAPNLLPLTVYQPEDIIEDEVTAVAIR